MVNIINKNHTHRTAIAEAIVTVSTLETIHAILEKKCQKEMCLKVQGLLDCLE